MRIGELAELSNTPTRSLRYYEEQGLLTPRRLDNGYRDYEPHLIDRAIQIRGLIDSGVPSRVIALILPCLDHNRSLLPGDIGPELLTVLREERDRMSGRIEFLTANRESLTQYIAAADAALTTQTANAADQT
jgi:DNA-binding transcriptional MerR regulator